MNKNITLSEKDKSKSYFNQENDILGCKHYPRNCKIVSNCCGRVYVCRLCHNEDPVNSLHEIDRHATKDVLCMFCNTLQPVSQQCINQECLKQFSRYFCAVCNFFDDTPLKKIYHCTDCGICRIGDRNDFKHCNRCNGCLSIISFDKHKCIENKFTNCPICLEDMFSSRESSTSFPCGHSIHSTCYDNFIKSKAYQCPICKKSIVEIKWTHTDRMIAASKMPPMYDGSTADILCNDCNTKSHGLPFHFVGQKCSVQSCGSYNTTIISKNIIVDNTKDSSFQVVNPTDNDDDSDDGDDEILTGEDDNEQGDNELQEDDEEEEDHNE